MSLKREPRFEKSNINFSRKLRAKKEEELSLSLEKKSKS
jgi:hypothetical protein